MNVANRNKQRIMTKDNLLEKAKTQLRRLGITSFIRYYEVFEEHHNESDNTAIFEAFDKYKEQWNSNSYNTKASTGKRIFRNNLESIALEYVAKSANKNRLSRETAEKANILMSRQIDSNKRGICN